jgi:hypothetical protein
METFVGIVWIDNADVRGKTFLTESFSFKVSFSFVLPGFGKREMEKRSTLCDLDNAQPTILEYRG